MNWDPNGSKFTLARLGKMLAFQLFFFFLIVCVFVGLEYFSIELSGWGSFGLIVVMFLLWLSGVNALYNEFFIEDFDERNRR